MVRRHTRVSALLAVAALALAACGQPTAVAPTAAPTIAAVPSAPTIAASPAAANGFAAIAQGRTPDGYQVLGAADAPVTLVMYSDFL